MSNGKKWLLTLVAAAGLLTSQAQNALSEKEKKEGWQLLFDGKSLNGWQKANGQPATGTGWVIENGELSTVKNGHGGDLITTKEYKDFEFTLEFKLEKGTNSGIKYHLLKNTSLGCEYQIIDDSNHVDAKLGKNGNRTLAALYDIKPPSQSDKKAKPLGEWNMVKIISKGNHNEHWLNGVKVLEYERNNEQFKEMIAASKFKEQKGFSETEMSPMLLQEHNDVIHYRNIKIKAL